MNHAPRLIAVLDACVRYPVPIRDRLLSLASAGLYQPKWSGLIQEEWRRNVLRNRPDLSAAQLERTTTMMNTAFPEAEVKGYAGVIPTRTLPDPADRHVLATAIRCRANVLVTANLKDFPAPYLRTFHIAVQHPDEFIRGLLDQHPEKAREAFRRQVARLKNPPLSAVQVLNNLRQVDLPATATRSGLLVAPRESEAPK